jgi:alpha-beta hydrolase superfamily lysophospholipase
MFDSFQLKSCGADLLGYRWEAESPVAVVCLLHGLGEHGGYFDSVAEAFKMHGISTFSFDLRGHGGSVGRRGHIGPRKQVLEDVDNLVAYAHNAHPSLPIVFYGFSMGGNIALDYRLRGRLSNLPAAYLVVSPWLKLCLHIPEFFYGLARLIAKVKPDFGLRAGLTDAALGNQQIHDVMREDKFFHDQISVLTVLENHDTAEDLMNGRIADLHGGGKKPLFLMHGTEDLACSIDATRAFASAEGANCVFTEWEGYAHEIHNSGPDAGKTAVAAMADIILGFAGPRSEAPV